MTNLTTSATEADKGVHSKHILTAATEAAAIARGEAPAACIYHNGIAYVPETEVAKARAAGLREAAEMANAAQAAWRDMDESLCAIAAAELKHDILARAAEVERK